MRPLPRHATYRLQLGPQVSLQAAAGLVDYLAELGASHLYLSPVWPAVEGSEHGYDVVARRGVREEIGGEEGLRELARAAHGRGLGLLLDIVPSHVAATLETPAWRELLSRGRSGPAAEAFDVDWEAGEGRVLLPILDAPYDEALDGGALVPCRAGADVVVRSPAGELPASAESVAWLLGGAEPPAGPDGERRLDAALAELGRAPERLRAFLARQHWAAIHWRDRRRNVRRFFDIDDLVALRSDREAVFRRTHADLERLVREERLDGLRVDHVDGLRDPRAYLERLRELAPDAWILVEKILAEDEELPEEWPIDGTTGYELAARASALLVDEQNAGALAEVHRAFTGEERPWPQLVRETRAEILERLFAAELERCERSLERAALTAGSPAPLPELRRALRAYLVELDVYRTYLRPGEVRQEDRERVAATLERARRRAPELTGALGVLAALLLPASGAPPNGAADELVARVQTLAPALMAKSVEDTALYRYTHLAALGDVGSEPREQGLGPDVFHDAMARAAARPRAGLFALSTHDAKRGADVRARLALLSERPREWSEALGRWSRRAERHRGSDGLDRRMEYFVWQILVGAWPLEAERALAYFEKAAREAKLHTSWRRPDEGYERALTRFVRGVLTDGEIARDLAAFARELVDPGRCNSLAQVLVAATACAVPDVYGGDELWNLVLVDPDNRRPVDFEERALLLRELRDVSPEDAWERREEGAPKLFLWSRALRLRHQRPAAFAPGARYRPLRAEGRHARRAVGFERGRDAERVVAVAPRLPLGRSAGWEDTTLELPDGRWRDVLGGGIVEGGPVSVESLVARFPVALLAREDAA